MSGNRRMKRRPSFVDLDWLSGRVNKLQFPQLTEDALNSRLLKMRYEVRGVVVNRALELQKDLDENKINGVDNEKPFDEVILCNIGNPQRLGQHPITFFRQVLSLCIYPDLLNSPEILKHYPNDAIQRAKNYLDSIPGGLGAYSNSVGVPVVREEVAHFIEQRDDHSCIAENVFLASGASNAVKYLINSFIGSHDDCTDGVMIPIPQYPLYSASMTLSGGTTVPYYLDEENDWNTTLEELEKSFNKAKDDGIRVRMMVVINPGNPTGQCLSRETIEGIIKFCTKNKIILVADEVYQTNIYEDTPFISFHHVVHEMDGDAYFLPLVSLHSISKGFIGECGLRGGYMHMHGIPQEVKAMMYKYASVSLCPNLVGQLTVGLMCNPPLEGDESYELYCKERDTILASLKRRAKIVANTLNTMEGVTCNKVQGALYAFPKITLPEKLIKVAEEKNLAPDAYYCLELLEATGVVVVPGSGFLQKDGTWHFRITILPPEDKIEKVLQSIQNFHSNFLKKFN